MVWCSQISWHYCKSSLCLMFSMSNFLKFLKISDCCGPFNSRISWQIMLISFFWHKLCSNAAWMQWTWFGIVCLSVHFINLPLILLLFSFNTTCISFQSVLLFSPHNLLLVAILVFLLISCACWCSCHTAISRCKNNNHLVTGLKPPLSKS